MVAATSSSGSTSVGCPFRPYASSRTRTACVGRSGGWFRSCTQLWDGFITASIGWVQLFAYFLFAGLVWAVDRRPRCWTVAGWLVADGCTPCVKVGLCRFWSLSSRLVVVAIGLALPCTPIGCLSGRAQGSPRRPITDGFGRGPSYASFADSFCLAGFWRSPTIAHCGCCG